MQFGAWHAIHYLFINNKSTQPIDCLGQDCINSSALATEFLQSCSHRNDIFKGKYEDRYDNGHASNDMNY